MTDPAALPLFLVCGFPKSGTTFLQRLLSLHPEISCPSEQRFPALQEVIDKFLPYYREVMEIYDRRTGGQGAPEYGALIENEMLRAMVGVLARSFARGRPIVGLNDNSVFGEAMFYDNLFGHPKIVGIIRNPVDVGLSTWRHSRRLAKEEPANAARHLAIIDSQEKTVEGFIKRLAPWHRTVVEKFLEYAATRPNIAVVRYEALVASKEEELKRIFGFLGASHDDATVDRVAALSSRAAMAAASTVPAFFGLDPSEPRPTVSREFRRAILETALTPRMRAIGYELPALMLGH